MTDFYLTVVIITIIAFTSFGCLLALNVRGLATSFSGTDWLKLTTTTYWRFIGISTVVFGVIALGWVALQLR